MRGLLGRCCNCIANLLINTNPFLTSHRQVVTVVQTVRVAVAVVVVVEVEVVVVVGVGVIAVGAVRVVEIVHLERCHKDQVKD